MTPSTSPPLIHTALSGSMVVSLFEFLVRGPDIDPNG